MSLRCSLAAVATMAFLMGCASAPQTDGQIASFRNPLNELRTSTLTDAFSFQMREVKKLIEAGKYIEAEQLLVSEQAYFAKRLDDATHPLPTELNTLGEEVWRRKHEGVVARALEDLALITEVGRPSQWRQQSETVRQASKLAISLEEDFATRILRKGADRKAKLQDALARVTSVLETGRDTALELTFVDVVSSGSYPKDFSGRPLEPADYLQSQAFQSYATRQLSEQLDRSVYLMQSQRLAALLTESSREAIDRQFVALVRKDFLADGVVSMQELAAVLQVRTPFGGAADSWASLLRIGHIDLSKRAERANTSMEFEAPLKQDLPLIAVPADLGVLRTADLGGFDYIVITELAQAKLGRDFKSKTTVGSRRLSGERQEPNPAFIGAMAAYQQAMAEYQRVQISAAMPRACSGWGCALQGIADGLAQGVAQRKVDDASQLLAQTSRTVTVPVFTPYEYELVDVSVMKTADVRYHIVDAKTRRVLQSSYALNEHETFRIAYNVHAEDPEKRSIRSRTMTEEELSEWEKQSVELPLSALLRGKPSDAGGMAARLDLPTLLADISQPRLMATSVRNAALKESPLRATAHGMTGGDARAAIGRTDGDVASQTIADDRFDSVVVVKSGASVGAGFYVTPDLVLTAYHVVRGSDLSQLSFHDGSKSSGRVVHHDVRLDLALIRTQMPGKPLKIHSGALRLGETVEAIGHPKGYDFTITRGVVSALRKQRSANISSDSLVEFVQTDTPISSGNSGGPLLQRDVVIGVNDWIRVDKGSQNLNFSVSYNEIRLFLDRFLSASSQR